METVRTIFYVIGMIVASIFILGLFIQTNKELWEKVGKDALADFKDWFKSTSLGMWYSNKKNGIEILSDKEYENLLNEGKIFPIDIEQFSR
jgi:hypothetical protein